MVLSSALERASSFGHHQPMMVTLPGTWKSAAARMRAWYTAPRLVGLVFVACRTIDQSTLNINIEIRSGHLTQISVHPIISPDFRGFKEYINQLVIESLNRKRNQNFMLIIKKAIRLDDTIVEVNDNSSSPKIPLYKPFKDKVCLS